jgi:hypothetical protein
MKRNLIALSAVVLAISFSAFTPKFSNVYMVYKGPAFAENALASYNQQASSPGTDNQTITIWWFKANAGGDSQVDATEFATAFNALDTDHDNIISDQSESADLLEKTRFPD